MGIIDPAIFEGEDVGTAISEGGFIPPWKPTPHTISSGLKATSTRSAADPTVVARDSVGVKINFQSQKEARK